MDETTRISYNDAIEELRNREYPMLKGRQLEICNARNF